MIHFVAAPEQFQFNLRIGDQREANPFRLHIQYTTHQLQHGEATIILESLYNQSVKRAIGILKETHWSKDVASKFLPYESIKNHIRFHWVTELVDE